MPEVGIAVAAESIVESMPANNPTPVTRDGLAALLRAA
jgi:hypothetical protein